MSENKSYIGQIQIADEVIAVIAGTAALEIDGVAFMSGNFTGDIVEILGKKHLSKGVKLTVKDNEVLIGLNLLVKAGYKIQDVSREVQERVKTAVETMTGLAVMEVNVNVLGVHSEKAKTE